MAFRWLCACGNPCTDTPVCPACGEETAILKRDSARLEHYIRDSKESGKWP